MTTETESVQNVFEQAFDNVRKTAESSLEMQQELVPPMGCQLARRSQPQNAWVERVQKFQKDWAKTVKELLPSIVKFLDEQYRLAMESLEEAFRVARVVRPAGVRRSGAKSLCKKSLEVLREVGELQVKETQETLNKWMD